MKLAAFSKALQLIKNSFCKNDLWLWLPVLFGFGAAFYIVFEQSFLAYFVVFVGWFFVALFCYFLNRYSLRALIFLSCCLFLAGAFYAYFYQQIFFSKTTISGKIYVDVVGKVESVKQFYNPINGVKGANLVITNPVLYKAKFVEKPKKNYKKIHKKKQKLAKKKKKIKKDRKKKSAELADLINSQSQEQASVESSDNSQKKSLDQKVKKKKSRKKKISKQLQNQNCDESVSECDEVILGYKNFDYVSTSKIKTKEQVEITKPKVKKPKKKKAKKPKKISEKTIEKNFINLAGFQEVDRKFLDYSKNYQQVEWLQIKGYEQFPNPPQKISLNLIKNFQAIAVNDLVAVRAMLQPPKAKEFLDDFDFARDAKFKKIAAFGFALGEAKILKKTEVSNLDEWFLQVRQKIRNQILTTLSGNSAAIALAFLIGDQSEISPDLNIKIRNSGLAHLLSISGFHLSLAAAIFFVATRFVLSRSQYLALRFDLKKIAALAALLATYFYLKIAASPLPAQRAFLMVLLVLIALFVGEKINVKRAVMTGILVLILFNPYAVFNVSFQLSFAAILVLSCCFESVNRQKNLAFLPRVFWYFFEIILLSVLIQVATTPFLMHSFQNLSLLGFLANILAIPLTSFFVMPLGFLALFLMPLGLEKYALLAMAKGILLIEKIAVFIADLNFSHAATQHLSSLGLILAIIGLLLICLSRSYFRIVGVTLFLLSFATIFFDKKPNILFDSKQKFFALYNKESGLVFSKDLKPSKQRKMWMKKMGETEFKSLKNYQIKTVFCDEKKCLIEQRGQKILVLLKRNKISEICQNDFDVIVNLTKKYELPSCIPAEKIKIDNVDFYQKGGQFFYFVGGKLSIKTTS